jgi:hypothetical protein
MPLYTFMADWIQSTFFYRIQFLRIMLMNTKFHGPKSLEKILMAQLVNKFPAIYGIRRCITVFTRARLRFCHHAHIRTIPVYLRNDLHTHEGMTAATSRPALGFTQPPTGWIPGSVLGGWECVEIQAYLTSPITLHGMMEVKNHLYLFFLFNHIHRSTYATCVRTYVHSYIHQVEGTVLCDFLAWC